VGVANGTLDSTGSIADAFLEPVAATVTTVNPIQRTAIRTFSRAVFNFVSPDFDG